MTEEKKTITVTEMLRQTGSNTAFFMGKVAEHIEQLEAEIAQLRKRIEEFENASTDRV